MLPRPWKLCPTKCWSCGFWRDHTMACVPIMKRLAGKLPTVSLGSASRGETAKGQTETTKCRDAKIGKQWSEPIGVGAIRHRRNPQS